MRLNGRMQIQLAVFTLVALAAMGLMTLHFMKLPAMLFDVGRYEITLELAQTGGLYSGGNVTYRGTEVGRVDSVQLTPTGVEAVLSLKSGIDVPSDLRAEVHSQSAIGEQYVALLPRTGSAPPLKNGDVISLADTSVPPDVNALLSDASTGLRAIPRDDLKTVIDESYTAVGGLGPELSRIVKGSADLAIEARNHLDPLITLIDQSQPVLDSQTNTSEAIQSWASHLATVTTQLQSHDEAVAHVIDNGGAGRRRGPSTRRPGPAHAADRAGQLGQRRSGRGDLPRQHRTAPGALPSSGVGGAGRAGCERQHQAGLQRAVPQLQPQHQPAAGVQHRLPARAATADGNVRRRSGSSRRRPVLPRSAGFAVQCSWRAQYSV